PVGRSPDPVKRMRRVIKAAIRGHEDRRRLFIAGAVVVVRDIDVARRAGPYPGLVQIKAWIVGNAGIGLSEAAAGGGSRVDIDLGMGIGVEQYRGQSGGSVLRPGERFVAVSQIAIIKPRRPSVHA